MKKILLSLLALCSMTAMAKDYTNGFFILNEDWFGHNSSTVNFYSYDSESIDYRVYQAANPGLTLGNTTQFAELGHENIYFCSKQNYGQTGGRFIVADAKTLTKKYSIDEYAGDGDSRAFIAVNDDKGYVSTTKGVYVFDIKNMTMGDKIAKSDAVETANMIKVADKVLVTARSKGFYVIDIATNKLVKTVEVPHLTSVFTIDGAPYAAVNSKGFGAPEPTDDEKFVKINPSTFDIDEEIMVPMASANTWFAWKNCAPAVDNENKVLYYSPWENATFISKYDVATSTFTKEFIKFDKGQKMYGSVVGFDAEKKNIVAMTFNDFSSQDYWLNIYNLNGEKVKQVKLKEHYWFPAMLLFAPTKVVTGVDRVEASKTVTGVHYVNLAGVQSEQPFAGINIKVTTYSDGSTTAVKVMQ